MITVRNIEDIKDVIAGSCVTIGNFDGVHKGHQKLIHRTCSRAEARGLVSVVVTFDPHPLKVLSSDRNPPFITLTEQKLELLSQHGPQVCLLLHFTMEMAKLTPEEFVRKYLLDGVNMKELIIGYDYHLGKGRTGDFATLTRLGKENGFTVDRLDPVTIEDAVVSSTRIRDLVHAGHVWAVRPLLGRFYQVKGEVVHGMNRGGRLLGFPTANLKLMDELFPKPGVYANWVEVDGRVHMGVANIGRNPTFGNDALSVEAHLLDFKGDLYGRDIRVHFVQRIRDEKKFSGIDELKDRIGKDIELGRQILSQPEAEIQLTRPAFENGSTQNRQD
ncbi:bifunctional riboflavin kinase/FAD synthetase [Pseudodesulfovibrio piezophilus]|uniref:Riboflavin biosynthesis protein n=1 Tax=Pseudodesulfovibrio piezophilus (strain DSM 21447 / JCM 15486 / C1TLV30) TaxID=1322246 RepID=M1WLR5_PSEP2|nr:bifunctional riboflavin kinase/FAD synthetase [Pseudodesulfovibrio piezophilus]CCH48320.1 Riboflavin biosynthesis protein RibF [Pseudodesulfovibrio piezophilus C1TLV30]